LALAQLANHETNSNQFLANWHIDRERPTCSYFHLYFSPLGHGIIFCMLLVDTTYLLHMPLPSTNVIMAESIQRRIVLTTNPVFQYISRSLHLKPWTRSICVAVRKNAQRDIGRRVRQMSSVPGTRTRYAFRKYRIREGRTSMHVDCHVRGPRASGGGTKFWTLNNANELVNRRFWQVGTDWPNDTRIHQLSGLCTDNSTCYLKCRIQR